MFCNNKRRRRLYVVIVVLTTSVYTLVAVLNKLSQPDRIMSSGIQQEFSAAVKSSPKFQDPVSVQQLKEGHNTKKEDARYEIQLRGSVGLVAQGLVVDCISWDERYRYDVHNLTTTDFDVNFRLRGEAAEERRKTFQTIFERRDWPSPDDTFYTGLKASGPGATLHNAQRVIATLHSVITRLKTHLNKSKISLLDLPCGDLQWMSRFLDTRWDIDYTGVDLVPEIIQNHKQTFKRIKNAEFLQFDIVLEKLNRSFDLILCRDMLQHLWLTDSLTVLRRFSESNSRFLLVTTFTDTSRNVDVDIYALGSRLSAYNLQLPPFSLPPPSCISYDWNIEKLALWPLPLKQII